MTNQSAPNNCLIIMSTEIQLIGEIEKRQCLYNFNCPEYNRKEITDEAWNDVAHCTNLAVSDCKEKWRNIRSSFLRSLKHGVNKTKKPYYLSEFLQFLVPYYNTIQNYTVNTKLSQQGQNDVTEPDIEIKQEVVDEDYENDQQYVISVEKDNDRHNNTEAPPQPMRRKRRLCNFKSDSRFKMRRFLIRPSTSPPKADLTQEYDPANAMKYFLMSLLPEFDGMDEEQIRIFKIKVMMLINELKNSPKTQTLPNTNTENNRLQKRLINLLLKTLNKKT